MVTNVFMNLANTAFTEALMKRMTISLLALAAWPAVAAPLESAQPRVTNRPVEQFVGCFVASQKRASLPWSFVPKDHGGTISNLGASERAAIYFVGISDRGARREVRIEYASAAAPASRAIIGAVDQCI